MRLKNIFAAAVVAGVVGGMGYGVYDVSSHFLKESTITATVKQRAIQTQGGHGTYMIFTNKGVFTDADSLFKLKFNSSDVYNQINKGCTYQFNVHGWRVPFLSMYKNIDQVVKPVATKACPVVAPKAPKAG